MGEARAVAGFDARDTFRAAGSVNIREEIEGRERETLAAWGAKSADTKGRDRPASEDDLRTAFQRDRDRVLHCKAFRRLKGKTQVFLSPEGDHYRTRLTHTLEVSQIARTIARALKLNEDLVEAIALGHDLGHTPFGHAGESTIAGLMPGGFHHSVQSLRVVEVLEYDGQGLNLTAEVRDGIRTHSKGLERLSQARERHPAPTLEAEVVRVCDSVAYANHDLDDAVRAGLLKSADLPRQVIETLGTTHALRINTIVHDIVHASAGKPMVAMSPRIEGGLETLRSFLVERLYEAPEIREAFGRARQVLERLWAFYLGHPEALSGEPMLPGASEVDGAAGLQRRVCDWVAGMTDQYALAQFERHLMPHPWTEED